MSRNTENFIAPGRGVFIMHYLDFGSLIRTGSVSVSIFRTKKIIFFFLLNIRGFFPLKKRKIIMIYTH